MSLTLIARALEKKLASLTPTLPTAGENGTYQPVTGQAYQSIALIPANTVTRDLRGEVNDKTGIFQITVCYPSAQGPVAARARADLIVAHFAPRSRLTEGDVKVEITNDPSIGPALTPTGWYCLPVRVFYRSIK